MAVKKYQVSKEIVGKLRLKGGPEPEEYVAGSIIDLEEKDAIAMCKVDAKGGHYVPLVVDEKGRPKEVDQDMIFDAEMTPEERKAVFDAAVALEAAKIAEENAAKIREDVATRAKEKKSKKKNQE